MHRVLAAPGHAMMRTSPSTMRYPRGIDATLAPFCAPTRQAIRYLCTGHIEGDVLRVQGVADGHKGAGILG